MSFAVQCRGKTLPNHSSFPRGLSFRHEHYLLSCLPEQCQLHLLCPVRRLSPCLAGLADEAKVSGGGLGFPSLPDVGQGVAQVLLGLLLIAGQHGQFEKSGMIPVVGLPGRHLALDGVGDDGNEFLALRIGWSLSSISVTAFTPG